MKKAILTKNKTGLYSICCGKLILAAAETEQECMDDFHAMNLPDVGLYKKEEN